MKQNDKQIKRIRRTIDLEQYKKNLRNVKKEIPKETKLIPIIKGNAYGHGLTKIAKAASEVPHVILLGVAYPEEIYILDETDIKTPRLLLSEPLHFEEKIVSEKTHFSIYTDKFIKKLNRVAEEKNCMVNVHIKVNTGMNRFGACPSKVNSLIFKIKQATNLKLAGIFSHLSNAESPEDKHTIKQIKVFDSVINKITKENQPEHIHICNSAGTKNLPHNHYTAVRIGIKSFDNVMTITTHIKSTGTLLANNPLGYTPLYTSDKEIKYAVIEIGYRDGIPSNAQNKTEVLVNGQRAKMIGRICMDCCFIDITHIDSIIYKNKVTILGREEKETITPQEWQKKMGINPRELLIRLGQTNPFTINLE